MALASDTRPAVLLTGFGPFPGVDENASGRLVEALAHVVAKRFPQKRIVAHVLPTQWAAAPVLLGRLYDTHNPMLVLHFGVTQGVTGFSIETQAQNKQGPHGDAIGALPRSPVMSAKGKTILPVSIPAPEILARLRRLAIPAQLSHDAGDYLCNCILYRSLELASRAGVAAGFIHIPADFASAKFDFEMAVAGGLEIVRACLGRPVANPRPPR